MCLLSRAEYNIQRYNTVSAKKTGVVLQIPLFNVKERFGILMLKEKNSLRPTDTVTFGLKT